MLALLLSLLWGLALPPLLANTLFVSLALGLLISAFSRNESRALTVLLAAGA